MNWIKLLTLLKFFWEGIASISNAIKSAALKKKQQSDVKKAEDAVSRIEESNKIENTDERLKKKAEAACELEKVLNPNSDC